MDDALPSWDLTELYTDDEATRQADLADVRQKADALSVHKGSLASQPAEILANVIASYQKISETLSRMMSHADLAFAADMSNAENASRAQNVREALSDLSSGLLFIELELAEMDEDAYQTALKTPEFYAFEPWLRRLRLGAPYQLETRLEQMLVERAPTGRGAWVRLFDETMTAMRFPFKGGEVSESEILNALSDTDAETRREAGQSFSSQMDSHQRLFCLIMNTIVKDKEIDDRWRGFGRPVSARNLANDVDDVTVDALAEAVTSRMPDIAHRYYQMKADWMGVKQLNWWDRNAPLPGDDDRRFSWNEAQDIVMSAFGSFDDGMAGLAGQFFDKSWIDAAIRSGKTSGAFSHPTVPSAHPYILMNFDGKSRDVMTLAHEMGHGVHQILAGPQGYLMADTPLTLAETASVFAEMLTFTSLMDRTDDPARRRFLLAGKVEDMMNTVVRQIAFHNFETRVHDSRKQGELSAEMLGDIWMETQTQALGPAVYLDESYRPVWSYIPHFIHTPFYVYAYAFGDCLVNALWQKYRTSGVTEQQSFIANYKGLLSAGGTVRYDAALEVFGLDATDKAFWHLGLDMISAMIDELETL